MKHFYCRSGIFRIFQTFGIFLTSLTLLSSCSNELEEFSSELKEDKVTLTSTKDDSVLRFKTIDELENISIKDIPGDNDGFELKELSYECVDTIELRALRFDVRATLCSSSNQKKVISFTAEVGPELVSVEYYPGGEMVPAHHNMRTAFYPKVERYRNYSDGSRIGPDEFYDNGHFLGISISTQEVFFPYYPSVTRYEMDVIPIWIGNEINPEYEFFENGIFYCKKKTMIEHNLNTKLIEDDGSIYYGEDFFNIIPLSEIYDEPFISEQSTQMIGKYYIQPHYDNDNFYVPGYITSLSYEDLDDEKSVWLNLCSDVPDVSSVPYPKDTESLKTGWYFGNFSDRFDGFNYLFSKHNITMDRLFFNKGIKLFCSVWGHLQYLVIDNRIIHFDNYALNGYVGIENIKPVQNITKTSDGYLIRTEIETKLYGEKFKSIYDIEMKGVAGPDEIIDNSSYDSLENNDRNELDMLTTKSGDTRSASSTEQVIRKDGKFFSIDRSLPYSLRLLNKTRTINSFDR